jgi:hypothetical protein
MGSLSELADSLTPNVPARMTNLGANSDNLLDRDICDDLRQAMVKTATGNLARAIESSI